MIEDQIKELTQQVADLTEKVALLEHEEKWLSVKELAELMKVAPNTIYVKIRSGEIYASKKLGSPRIPISQFYKTEIEDAPEIHNNELKSIRDRIFEN